MRPSFTLKSAQLVGAVFIVMALSGFDACVSLNAPVKAVVTATTTTTNTASASTAGNIAWTTPSSNGQRAVLSNYASYPVAGTCLAGGAAITLSDAGGTVTASTTCVGGTWSANLDFTGAADGNVVITATQGTSTANRTIERLISVCNVRPGSTPVGQFADGDGTAGDPWIICTLADLNNVSANLTGGNDYFRLYNNVTVGGAFTPITGFANSDEFDGYGLTISTATLAAGAMNTGFFDTLAGSSYVHDLTLSNFTVNTGSNINFEAIGIAAGQLTGTARISDVHVGGSITYDPGTAVFFHFIGGLVGNADSTYAPYAISNCSSSATVNAPSTNNIGGLVSSLTSAMTSSYSTGAVTTNSGGGGLVARCEGTIDTSYSSSTVTGTNAGGGFLGGLVGSVTAVTCVITNSYATGTVANALAAAGSSSPAGGLVGGCQADVTITDSYATGAVNAPGMDNVGGLVGALRGTVSGSFATGNVSGHYAVGGFVGTSLNASTITDSYARTGTVSAGSNAAGGFVGDGSNLTVTRAYSNGAVSNVGLMTGGFNGVAVTACNDCFWHTVSSLQGASVDGTGLNAVQAIASGSYTNFVFPGTWKMDATLSTFPSLSWQ